MTSWMHPWSKHWHLIDYVIVRRRDLNEVQITRAMRGPDCSTDHRLIRSTLRLTVRSPARRQKPWDKLNVHAAHNQNTREELRNAIDQSLSHISTTTTLNCTSNLTMEWQALSSALLTASQSTLGNMERRHQDWFHDSATDIRSLIHDKNAAHDALLRNPTSRTLCERFSSICATVQRKLRWMENNWWAWKAAQIQSYANINDTKSFYEAQKGVYGPSRFSLHPVRSTDGVLIKKKKLILKRWAEYPQACLCYHCHSSTAPSYVTDMLHKKPLHTRNTRSRSYTMPLLNRPAHSKATLGDRSFSFASSSVWNSIPNDVRCAPSLSSFKSRLKTYLFRSVYKD